MAVAHRLAESAGIVVFCYPYAFVILLVVLLLRRSKKPLILDIVEAMNWLVLLYTVVYSLVYLYELFMAWYSAPAYEQDAFRFRLTGPYWWSYWTLIFCSVVVPHIFWWRKARRSLWVSGIMMIVLNFGLFIERLVIIITSLYRDYRPGAWTYYEPSFSELAVLPVSLAIYVVLVAVTYLSIRRYRRARQVA